MYQAQFFNLYDKWLRFADGKAKRYFHDESQRLEAVDKALAKCVDNAEFTQVGNQLITPILDLEVWGKLVITNSLKDSSKAKKTLEPINIEGDEFNNMHGYRLV